MKRIKVFVNLLCLSLISSLDASEPTWWTQGTSLIDPNGAHSIQDNYSPANLGQLKNVAKKAKFYLNTSSIPGGAGSQIENLISGFSAANLEDNYSPVNIGQLKAIAKPFYDRLLSYGYDANAALKSHGYPEDWQFNYPWNPASPVSENYQIANIGQLKVVFSFEVNSFGLEVIDSDGDGLPDWWETFYFGATGASPTGSGDSDGISNYDEFLAGTDPTKNDTDGDGITDQFETTTSAALADSDGDLLPDKWEQVNGPNPVIDNRNENPDSDSLGRTLEHLSGRNPTVADSRTDSTDRALDIFSAF